MPAGVKVRKSITTALLSYKVFMKKYSNINPSKMMENMLNYIFSSVCGMCFAHLHHFHQYSLISREGLCLLESNQQICDFYSWIIFEKQRHCEPQSKLFYQQVILQSNTSSCCVHITSAVNILSICVCQSNDSYVSRVSLYVCDVISKY